MAFNSHNAAEDNDAKSFLYNTRVYGKYSRQPQSGGKMEKFFSSDLFEREKKRTEQNGKKMRAMRLFPITAITSC